MLFKAIAKREENSKENDKLRELNQRAKKYLGMVKSDASDLDQFSANLRVWIAEIDENLNKTTELRKSEIKQIEKLQLLHEKENLNMVCSVMQLITIKV